MTKIVNFVLCVFYHNLELKTTKEGLRENAEWLLMSIRFLFWGDENILKLMVIVAQYTECH